MLKIKNVLVKEEFEPSNISLVYLTEQWRNGEHIRLPPQSQVLGPKTNLTKDSDEDIRLNESDCEESEESADITDNSPANPDIYVARDVTEWIPHNSNVPGRFATPNALQQSSGSTIFAKHNDKEIVTSVQEESNHVDDETDEDENNNNGESSKGP
ncbi:uncharacterized protein TNCV_676211 [Trichonephila clavipes]|nr:uncharacterized protein TNCV_676211 [Trichonephila clavipes]